MELLTKEQLAKINKEQGHAEYLKVYTKQKYNTDEVYRERKKAKMREYQKRKTQEKKILKEEFIDFLKSFT